MNLNECQYVIRRHLKTQSLEALQRMLSYAQEEKMEYRLPSCCLLGLSDGGYSRNVEIDRKGKFLDVVWERVGPVEQAFHEMSSVCLDEERNRLMVPLLEAELLSRELETSPATPAPTVTEAVEANPSEEVPCESR
jgi:hypothetical protein